MPRVSYKGLLNATEQDLQSLTKAALVDGYFDLDLDCPEAVSLRQDVRYLESFSERIFDVPTPLKERYDFKTLGRFRTTGFKSLGVEEGAHAGQPDGFEMFMLPQNELLLPSYQPALQSPDLVFSNREPLTHCMKRYEEAAQLILRRVGEVLGLADSLLAAHQPNAPSVTNLGFLKYPPQPTGSRNFGHIAHTDVGTLTILSATARGLQIMDVEKQDWVFVEPNPQQLFVQFGDCLKFLSQGRCIPSIHRVVPCHTEQATKYTLAYFVRPNEKAIITSDDGTVWAYEDYHCRKFDAFARPLTHVRPEGEQEMISIRQLNLATRVGAA
ncbi:Clavaminate synthase-like protein [Penicillium cf. griseofulvum]|uniref:Clavaminate synthase-like protein n=1 Tax=Penicillium cf. griseofulvum TaxID=2972120 RepID=A0A9W9T2I1_9EURO|nr:Clavaminate synthase-like protein [Penicillium cf. griseofulvum]KAJ5446414.1 Clavaminate synthase-like protein [Penicillium cf. griseofulvum]KAJ5448155.1 Clavaminate synthase-like protein [Penicillium cf. griseofulvum]